MAALIRRRGPALLIGLQVLALVVVAGASVTHVQRWSLGDEAAHYDYVQTIAEDGRLPRITEANHHQVREIFYSTYPRPAPAVPGEGTLVNRSYEAFQPPLYYALAAPAFLLRADHFDKIRVLRWFDVLLLLVAVGAVALLARAMLGPRWPVGLAGGLCVLLWPGLVVRGVTVSPAALEVVVVTALVAVLWRVARDGGRRWVLAAGVLLGACALTKGTLVFVAPLWLVVIGRDLLRRRDAVAVAGAVAIVAVLVGPWLVFNLTEYGTLTAAEQAQDQQRYQVNPAGTDFGPADALRSLSDLPDDVLAGEFRAQLDVWWIKGATLALVALLAAGWLVGLARRASRWLVLFAGAPLACGLLVLATAMVTSDWPTLTGRYLYAAVPALAVALAAVAPPRLAWGAICGAFLVVAVLWVDMAGAFYFTNVGDALGI